jgi:hypothetical protein
MAQEYTDGGAGWDDKEYERSVEKKQRADKEKKQRETTDCRSEEGITVGLIDALIALSRVVNQRLKVLQLTPAVEEAIKDLKSDTDLKNILKP